MNILRKLSFGEWILLAVFFGFSFLIMIKTFSLNDKGDMLIATKAWSDFAATIPLIRSFSFGDNFPPQYPIYPGPPIRYHFVFFATVGLLEKIGMPIDVAFNGLSIISFFLLLCAIYFFGKFVFKNKTVGAFSVLLFLFNGSWGFLGFFQRNPLSRTTLIEIINNTQFSSFGPYDGNIVSAFWSLNIFTNQRHLALGYAIFFIFLIYIFSLNKLNQKLSLKNSILPGVLIGLLPFVHFSVFIMIEISLAIFFLLFGKIRKNIFIIGVLSALLAIPQYLYMGSPEIQTQLINPGYLVARPVNFGNFVIYWFLNLGITAILAPVGYLLANKDQRKMAFPFILFFIVANIFQFAPDLPTNHKFINLFVIGLNFYTSFLLLTLLKKGVVFKFLAIVCIPILTLSGVIDLFPILNDNQILLEDINSNNRAAFIKENTPANSIFLNSHFIFDSASVAGRKIYLGWPYFSWSAGYDTTKRYEGIKSMLLLSEKNKLCEELVTRKIDFVEIQKPQQMDLESINYEIFDTQFVPVYSEDNNNYQIFSVKDSCHEDY